MRLNGFQIKAFQSLNDGKCRFKKILPDKGTESEEFLFGVPVLVNDLHLFHNCRLARFPRTCRKKTKVPCEHLQALGDMLFRADTETAKVLQAFNNTAKSLIHGIDGNDLDHGIDGNDYENDSFASNGTLLE